MKKIFPLQHYSIPLKNLSLAVFIYCLSSNCVFAQEYIVKGLLTNLTKNPKEDTAKVNTLNKLSYQYQWFDFDSSLFYADQALTIAEKIHYTRGAAMAYFRKSHCQWAMGVGVLSIESALKAIALGEQDDYKNVIAESYRMLAFNYRDQREVEKAQEYVDKAEELALEISDWDLLVRVYNLDGILAENRNPTDTATSLSFFYKALTLYKEKKTSKVHACSVYGNMGDIYLDVRDFDKALSFYSQGLDLAREVRNRAVEAGIMTGLGRNSLLKKEYGKAEQTFKQALAISRDLKLKRLIMTSYAMLSDTYQDKGDALNAVQYMHSYYVLRDSITLTRNIVELEQRLASEKREQEIQILEQQKKTTNAWLTFLIVGTLTLTIALIIIYRLQRSRNQRGRRLLEIQRQLNTKLTETDELKSRFFANISHEFRTPLSLILAPIERKLNLVTISKEDKKDFSLVKRNAHRLLDLINQLLDLSKLEVNKMKLHIQQGKLEDFLKILTSSFDSLAESKRIEFTKHISITTTEVWFDKDKIEKIITNILFNAFKFTPSGERVELTIYTSNEDGNLHIHVKDTGKGIHEDDLKNVFSPFYQSKYTSDDGNPGTGLGLSLVNELVKLHNGEIKLTSKPGYGTLIEITLSIRKRKPSHEVILLEPEGSLEIKDVVHHHFVEVSDDVPSEKDHANTLLIVEDNPELREFIASNFREHYNVITAQDGSEGLDLAIETVPDLIISDVMMPKMDGLTLIEKIKSDERTSHIPVILLTAKADSGSKLDGLRMGADDYLAKPFSTEELLVRIINLIEIRKKLAARYREQIESPSVSITTDALLPPRPVERSLDDKFLDNVMSIVEKNLGVSSFSVEQLADEMCLSRTQLFRKVKGLLEVSPNELITNVRLQRAAELIKAKADTLTQISYSVGFNEQSYFAKRFRKKYGMSPSEYGSQ